MEKGKAPTRANGNCQVTLAALTSARKGATNLPQLNSGNRVTLAPYAFTDRDPPIGPFLILFFLVER